MCVLCLFFLQKWGSKCHCVCGKKHVTGTPPSVPCSRARSVSLSLSRMFSPSPRNSLPGSQWLLPYADFCLDGAPGCLLCQESCWVCLPGPGLSRSGLSVPWATIWVGHSLSVPPPWVHVGHFCPGAVPDCAAVDDGVQGPGPDPAPCPPREPPGLVVHL